MALIILWGEYNIAGFRNKDIRMRLKGYNSGKVSRLIKHLKIYDLIKKAGKTYKYYLTKHGKELFVKALRLRKQYLFLRLIINILP